MSDNRYPNLNEWFEVPVGKIIPAGTAFAVVDGGTTTIVEKGHPQDFMVVAAESVYLTREPIRPKLPTAPGTWIRAEVRGVPNTLLMLRESGDWVGVNGEGGFEMVTNMSLTRVKEWEVVGWMPIAVRGDGA